ncbi:hypothetical protein POJ06DRAFT_242114 [Lipomyces tetrasporus]|uniref:DNA topoisomerase I n=1 Tax=Lipomyces tetrasporus TaxID=54092 RepID=A0AAD7QY07_9ASCO|nr:uncharacterized protein POJ06DRAFT_242114 [Lipomyces tetrasporus]KAJ8103519.1 hypothetical protein POJ06DRAFT_242114 [Lipomyces tetrasporus]
MTDVLSDEDVPLSKRRVPVTTKTSETSSKKRKSVSVKNEPSDLIPDDMLPLKKRGTATATVGTNGQGSAKKVKREEKPAKSTKVSAAKAKGTSNRNSNGTPKPKTVSDSGIDEKLIAKRKAKKADSKTEGEETSTQEKEEEELYKWWEAESNDGSVKWSSLVHSGVLFPPPYEPLPMHVKLKYKGVPVDLPPEAEEVAGFFGAMLETDHAKNKVFQANFFNDFKEVLTKSCGSKLKVEKFEHCDFTDIFNYYEEKRLEKKALTAAEKKKIKEEKDKLEETYKVCYLDGRKELVGNFRIEPPGLFRGRGSHPKTGKLKARVMPEQVTINIGPDTPVPQPPDGHEWAEVKHDNTVSWLATWKENINGAQKYVFLAANSSLKGMSDYKKFEKARELKGHITGIRKDYNKELKDELMANRQRATAMYLIDVLALRAGGEKGEDEADTVGCCSLRYEHVSFKPPNTIVLDFLGKDSIRFYQEVKVDPQVYKNLKLFKKSPKKVGDQLFDRLDPPTLNKHLQNYMPGLTAKVFRTYNASITMQEQLGKIENKGTVNEKYVAYNAANRTVAILCNHQRTVSKAHEQSVGKIEDKILEIKFQRYRLKQMIAQLEPNMKKSDPEYFQPDIELDDATMVRLTDQIIQRERDKVTKKFQRENEKRATEKEEALPESELNARMKVVDELEAEYKKERKTGKVELKNGMPVEKLKAQIEKLNERIVNTTLQLKDKEDNSTVALTTSKINYIDPRLTVMFSKKYEVPIEKLFSKTLREKFKWAIESADENWKF